MAQRRERKLPVQQLTILAICRFAEPIAGTSLFPYLPEMIKSFGVAENEVGKWAGLAAATFSLCQACAGVPWGRFSDVYGRKVAILLGMTSTMVTSLMWGFSVNLPMAIVARALAGIGNGNVGIIRTTVAEMVPFKELQPRAFSLMPLVWNIGSIFGPMIGGALANPFNVEPGRQFEHPSLFQRFPYALPNLVCACFFAIGITTGVLFLHETLESKRDKRDYGRILGSKLVYLVKSFIRRMPCLSISNDSETEPLLNPDRESGLPKPPQKPRPSIREVLHRQSVLNLTTYALFAMHTMTFDQLLPVHMQYPSIHSGSPDVTLPGRNPLKFAGGYSLDHFTIGMLSTAYGMFGMLVQFFVFPGVARRYGVLNCLKVVAWVNPIAYALMPFTALLPTQRTQVIGAFAVMLVKCFCGIFGFPCSTILLTNSAPSLQLLGTLNGLATSAAAIGRAVGPALGGGMFSLGVKHGYLILPWWILTAIALLQIYPVSLLEEGEGFGDDDDLMDEEDDEQNDEAGNPPRKMSIPIGMGTQGISRRLSCNLGQSLGSAASYNEQ
ncbi:MFS general substrate transporter [Piedraia hortae CBS 480.64]|uniref:MFS general substrate transporter n=1 Tax=Piedraia hortae CBS 480.64 TaxID=1314780 RepID=A0A6A7BXG7_9PEZI|nr:MFS general substrate transporter [Piedraia hortae CBS 480.64]